MARQSIPPELAAQLNQCMVRDRFSLEQIALGKRRPARPGGGQAKGKLDDLIKRSIDLAARRHAALPRVSYPEALPITARVDEIKRALNSHQVVIVAGETGSGKTTQLPKICLEAGRGVFGMIGHTQPRRVAARTVGARIAEELGVRFGEQVGYQVRFADKTTPLTHVKLMTDGILLAESQRDRFLDAYDTLIIDEAHERSLNIDFLLGYVRRILPRRPDLKVIVTSATIDVERFSRHFANAPIVQVSGRTYPVEVLYRPVDDEPRAQVADDAQQAAIVDAVEEVLRLESGHGKREAGILVFLPGEREIRETAQSLRRSKIPGLEVLPLYSRLSNAEQNRVFAGFTGRRVVLATNVAETSLTVPGIRYVIDTGVARISRYSLRSKVQQLPIERVSQASADQRKGRCGRLSDGVCIRLYAESDFEEREAFTQPEILRTNLAAVILQMLVLRLGDISRFPFVEMPDERQINDGFQLLFELGAVDHQREVTRLGKEMARFPVDMRFARMLIEAAKKGALSELLVIASALSVVDPRERPHESRAAADEKHVRFDDERSDFLGFWNLWEYYEGQRQALSQGQLRKLCQAEFLSFMRMREWRDVHRELTLLCRDMKLRMNDEPASYEAVHTALLTGLLGFVGSRDGEHEYLGARNRRYHIFPGSALFSKKPRWIVSGQLTQTSRLFGRNVASIDKSWIEPLAQHLVRRTYADIQFELNSGEVTAFEDVTLYSLPIVQRRKVNYAGVDPAQARAVFIQRGLVDGELRSKAAFYRHNNTLLAEVEALESKARKRDIMVRNTDLYDFYDKRLPANVCGRSDLDFWCRTADPEQPRKLYLTREQLLARDVNLSPQAYPESLAVNDLRLKLSYHFDPQHEDDGVSVTVPVAVLRDVPAAKVDWLIPGLLHEKCLALIRSLPKSVRKHFAPAAQYVDQALENMAFDGRPLAETFAERLFRLTGNRVNPADFRPEGIAHHLRMNIRIIDDKGKVLGTGRNLQQLVGEFAEAARVRLADRPRHPLEREGMSDWDCGVLPEFVEISRGALKQKVYPTFVDDGTSVAISLRDSPAEAWALMTDGLIRLFRLQLGDQVSYLKKNVPGFKKSALLYTTVGSAEALLEDVVHAVFRYTFCEGQAEVRSRETFQARLANRAELFEVMNRVGRFLAEICERSHRIRVQLSNPSGPAAAAMIEDVNQQLNRLVGPGFLRVTSMQWLANLPRFLKAIETRLDKGGSGREVTAMEEVARFEQLLDSLPDWDRQSEAVHFRWMLEEFRVSLFAQQLGTSLPVSAKRLSKQWDRVRQSTGIAA